MFCLMQEEKNNSKAFKDYIDKFLVINLFLIILGFLFFLFSTIAFINGFEGPFNLFQSLWFPVFIPALSTFFTAVLVLYAFDKFNT